MEQEDIYEQRLAAIAQRIKELRIEAGYSSYEKFAVQHELDRKHYWRMEKGQNISMKSLFKIIDIHKMDIQTFFKGLDFPSLNLK